MKPLSWTCPSCPALCVALSLALSSAAMAQEQPHEHSAPERLGKVSFPTSCRPEVQATFDRGVALLHSFAYSAADEAFAAVAAADAQCAMAHWGRAMTQFHQIWDPPLPGSSLERGGAEVEKAQHIGAKTEREREYVAALALVFQPGDSMPYPARARRYEQAMGAVAAHNPGDAEAQIFYALALLSTAPPDDRKHRNQKKAVEILEPLHERLPDHPGIVHYLIHACDNAEMASRGLPAARLYAQLAPSAPHALHMPSHIFTRLGMWQDSIQSNLAARAAAREQAETGEALHAMDYLVYAYLQLGRDADAEGVLRQLRAMGETSQQEFISGYAATAMPVRYAIERRQWAAAAECRSGAGAQPHVAAIAVWARAVGLAREGKPAAAEPEIQTLRQLEEQLRTSARLYWATQVHIQVLEASAWTAQANRKTEEAIALMRAAADQEDGLEKLPVTPGPITPAREQLGDLLLESGSAKQALAEFESSLLASPGRRGALQGALHAAEHASDETKARMYRAALEKNR